MDETQAVGNEAPVEQTDTVESQSSEASQNTNQAPEATQGEAPAKEVEAPEVKVEDTAEEKLYAGKYKTAEDMEKAYQELNSKFTNTSQEKAELAKILNEAFSSPEPASQQRPETDDYYQEESNPADQKIEALERKTAVQSFIISHTDADPATMQKVLSEDPLVAQINGHEAKLEYAYLRSQSLSSQAAIAAAEKRGADQTQAKIAEKQVAQVESATSAEQVDEKSELKNKAMTGKPDERKSARLEYIRKHLTNI